MGNMYAFFNCLYRCHFFNCFKFLVRRNWPVTTIDVAAPWYRCLYFPCWAAAKTAVPYSWKRLVNMGGKSHPWSFSSWMQILLFWLFGYCMYVRLLLHCLIWIGSFHQLCIGPFSSLTFGNRRMFLACISCLKEYRNDLGRYIGLEYGRLQFLFFWHLFCNHPKCRNENESFSRKPVFVRQ